MHTYFSRTPLRVAATILGLSLCLAACSTATNSPSPSTDTSHTTEATTAAFTTEHDMAGMEGMSGMEDTSGSQDTSATHDTAGPQDTSGSQDMAGMDMDGAVRGDGTNTTEAGYSLALVKPTREASDTSPIQFTINRSDGAAVTDYAVEQTKKLHLIVVRRDLSGYQHLHPTIDASGTWSTPAVLRSGAWRIIADFTPVTGSEVEQRTVLGADMTVNGTATTVPLLVGGSTAEVDGYTVTLTAPTLTSGDHSALDFQVSRDGKPVTDLEPYLGAFGHLVALRVDDIGYLHVHPTTEATTLTGGPNLQFQATFEQSGPHRLYLQFQTAGTVHTAEFTVNPT